MIEFVPTLRKTFASNIKKASKLLEILPDNSKPQNWPFRGYNFDERINLDRVVPGPPLNSTFAEYYLALGRQDDNNISSVRKSWRSGTDRFTGKMKCGITFLTTPTADTPGTTLILQTEQKRYIFGNISEGTQRAAIQRKQGLTRLADVFVTGPVKWSTTGGLVGLILTLADVAGHVKESAKNKRSSKLGSEPRPVHPDPWLNIHGGENLTHTLATTRRFVFRKGYPIHTQEYRAGTTRPQVSGEPIWKDEMLQVWPMVLEPEGDVTSITSRKRSHEDFVSDIIPGTESTEPPSSEKKDQYDQMRRSVVSEMFNSNWRMDALVKQKLSQVKLPAKIFIRSDEGKVVKYEGPPWNPEKEMPDPEVLVRNPWPGAMIEDLPPTTPVNNSVCYIIKLLPQRGKFDPKAAMNLKVKPGPDFRALTLGKSVTATDGTMVEPHQVMAPTKEGGGFVLLDLPDRTFVEAAVLRDEWSIKEIMNGVEAVVWILGPGVVDDPRIQNFMEEHKELKHIVSSTDVCSNYIANDSSATQAIKLRLVAPEHFSVPKYKNYVEGRDETSDAKLPYDKARIGKYLQLEPKVEIHNDAIVPYLDGPTIVEEADAEVQRLADEAREMIKSPDYQVKLDRLQSNLLCKDAEVTTLGTGSAAPSKYRNVSATLVRVPGYGSYLLDCGENTLGQLKRVFGDELPEVLRDLKVIWISHLHADHHLGTTSVIAAWNEATKNDEATRSNKLIISSQVDMLRWLREYSQVEDYGYGRLETMPISGRGENALREFTTKQTETSGLSSIEACWVDHCSGALAVVLSFPNGFKVAYSGDCRPSTDFARIGYGATLLIHEATFDDELQGDAYAKKHSTTKEALEVGRRMAARRILLTHFSQRYQKIPVMNENRLDQIAIVAFDYMRVKIGDFAKMDQYKPALMKLFEDEEGVTLPGAKESPISPDHLSLA